MKRGRDKGLMFNPKKTQAVVFERAKSPKCHRRILDRARGIVITEKQPNLEYSCFEWDNLEE